jgi:hypothetical protein
MSADLALETKDMKTKQIWANLSLTLARVVDPRAATVKGGCMYGRNFKWKKTCFSCSYFTKKKYLFRHSKNG